MAAQEIGQWKEKEIETDGHALTQQGRLFDELVVFFLLLQPDTISSLQPTLSGYVFIGLLIFLKSRQKGSNAANRSSFALSWRVV